MKTSIIGYPRVGREREMKFALEMFFRQELSSDEMLKTAGSIRRAQWHTLAESGLDYIPSGDHTLYDGMLDTSIAMQAVPQSHSNLGMGVMDTMFSMARGYQGAAGDIHALPMRKWFNTNYHYIVPLLERGTHLQYRPGSLSSQFTEAQLLGVETRPVLIGPFTFLKLSRYEDGCTPMDFAADAINAWQDVLEEYRRLGVSWVQLDEPALVLDLSPEDRSLFLHLHKGILKNRGSLKLLLQTYFGDVRDAYDDLSHLGYDGIGLDFVEGPLNADLIRTHGFPEKTILFAGLVNGKNIWKNNYAATLLHLDSLCAQIGKAQLVIGTSCSLLHVPYSLAFEHALTQQQRDRMAFAEEKLVELAELKLLADAPNRASHPLFLQNSLQLADSRHPENPAVRRQLRDLTEKDYHRYPDARTRKQLQQAALMLPQIPITTIGSFPQTSDVRHMRAAHRKGQMDNSFYEAFILDKIRSCIALQESLGVDVLVHGEYERNDMVEYFGENLDGFLFTRNAWVQSYGTRCVKPPIIWGDVSRRQAFTTKYITYAQQLTERPVKGMLTGPVTILNWSFPREDIPRSDIAGQIALAIREEVMDLEAAGIRIIQIDEAAIKEKFPLRSCDWQQAYLNWAIPAFRLTHSGVSPTTQIHTHMCYSEFDQILDAIADMDADVITFEAARSNQSILDVLAGSPLQADIGPGLYDIHSPRIPSVDELSHALRQMLRILPAERLWANPDCGLKTRGMKEATESLANLAGAVRAVRRDG